MCPDSNRERNTTNAIGNNKRNSHVCVHIPHCLTDSATTFRFGPSCGGPKPTGYSTRVNADWLSGQFLWAKEGHRCTKTANSPRLSPAACCTCTAWLWRSAGVRTWRTTSQVDSPAPCCRWPTGRLQAGQEHARRVYTQATDIPLLTRSVSTGTPAHSGDTPYHHVWRQWTEPSVTQPQGNRGLLLAYEDVSDCSFDPSVKSLSSLS